jgi:catechol 2,3-dioxygenase-like lactoylglutathione lyase family enzyme
MEQRLSLVTLGVADLARTQAFYEQVVGWKAATSPPGVVFFDLNGLVFSLFPHEELEKDMNAAAGSGRVSSGFALAYNARSREEVDAIFARLKSRGVNIVKAPEQAFWGGYSGYFSDPDGHKWEIAFNPYWTILPDGRISMTKE